MRGGLRKFAWLCLGLLPWLTVLGCSGGGASPPRESRRTVLDTEYDDERVGAQAAHEVEAEVGLIDDPALLAYVQDVAARLLRHAPRRDFEWRFSIVDQMEPNAFALPGGHIYVSRGLLALVSSEDELANVLGHEIVHAAARHAAARQAAAVRQNPFAMPYVRIARLAAYGRQQESDADRGGQILAARAGYDPAAMARFLRKLENAERLEMGHSRIPRFFDTHPGTVMRAADCEARARALSFTRGPEPIDRHLERIEGLELGSRPSEGVFEESLFMHPDLGFQVRFPEGWRLSNTDEAVGAAAPRGAAFAYVALDGLEGDPRAAAERFLGRHGAALRLQLLGSQAVQIGALPAWRITARALLDRRVVAGVLTFVPYDGHMYRITAVAPVRAGSAPLSRARVVARTFAPLPDEARAGIRRLRIRVVEARPGEGFESLGRRVDNALDSQRTAILNGAFVDARFEGGERIKVGRSEPYG